MKIKISDCGFLDVEFSEDANNSRDNSDIFGFKISAEGQKVKLNGVEVDSFEFTITGEQELSEFLQAMIFIDKTRGVFYEG